MEKCTALDNDSVASDFGHTSDLHLTFVREWERQRLDLLLNYSIFAFQTCVKLCNNHIILHVPVTYNSIGRCTGGNISHYSGNGVFFSFLSSNLLSPLWFVITLLWLPHGSALSEVRDYFHSLNCKTACTYREGRLWDTVCVWCISG